MEVKINREIRNYTESMFFGLSLRQFIFSVKYNGMTAEKAIYAWIKSEFLMPKKLVFHSTNVYYELMKSSIEQKQKDHFRESKT